MTVDTSPHPSRGRRIALRAVVTAFLLVGLAGLNFQLLLPLLSWLPDESLVQGLDFPEEDLPHFVHGVGSALTYGTLLLVVAVQLRRPHRWVAPLWLGIFLLGTQAIYDLVQRTVGDPIWIVVYLLFAAVVVLHPRRTARIRTARIRTAYRPALAVAVVGAVPLAVYGLDHLRLQSGPEDPLGHAAGNHYYGMAALASVIIVAALLGATELPGRRLAAWIAGVAPVLFAVASLTHAEKSSAWPAGWALAAIAGAAGYLLAVEWGHRRAAAVPRAAAGSPAAGSSGPER
jgi:hypothetical protein